MKTVRVKTAFAAIAACVVCIALFSWSCDGGASQQKVEQIDEAFRAGVSRLAETTAFIAALEAFDFENAGFLDSALDALDRSQDAAQELLASIDELRAISYGGDLSSLGGDMQEYTAAAAEAVDELEATYAGLQGILEAIEPVLSEETVITQLEEPGSNEELLGRLRELAAALDVSLTALGQVDVPALLEEYGSLLTDYFTVMRKLVGDLISAVSGQSPNVNMQNNPDFLRMEEMMAGYIPAVEKLYEDLKITRIDRLVEKVELAINELYMQVEQE